MVNKNYTPGAGLGLDADHISRIQQQVAEGNSAKTLSGKSQPFGGAAGSGAAMPSQNSEAQARDHFSRPKPPGVK